MCTNTIYSYVQKLYVNIESNTPRPGRAIWHIGKARRGGWLATPPRNDAGRSCSGRARRQVIGSLLSPEQKNILELWFTFIARL